MGGRAHFSVDLFLACLLLASPFVAINADDHQNEEEEEEEHPFNYLGETARGPEHWGELNPEWEACKNGKLQSPIDLVNERVQVLSELGRLRRTYKPAPAVMENRGHDIMVRWTGDAGGIILNNTKYKLVQCHWHTPSEHTVKGRKYRMELHMVHVSSEEEIAVVAILYKLGHPDTFLGEFLEHLDSIGDEEEEIGLGYVNPWDIKFGSRKYLRYFGSLTVPPCTEGVIWTILHKVRTVSMEQIRALRRAVFDGFENNARPTQSEDGRSLYLYRPLKI